jgi:ERCC4-type nuclease
MTFVFLGVDTMTDKRITEILQGITVIVDSREQDLHVTDYLDRYKIPYIQMALKFADYSFICPPIPEIGLTEPTSFEQRIAVERKSGLTELSGNLAQARERFENELQKAKELRSKIILLIENGSYEGILRHDYRTDLNEKSYIASLFSFQARYNLEIQFIPSKMSGWFIYNTFKYFLREELKNLVVG